jgi:hypothetical protein
MRIFFEEVVLDLPGVIDTEPVGELYLIERVLKQLEFVTFMPRPRELMFIEDAEFHGFTHPRRTRIAAANS